MHGKWQIYLSSNRICFNLKNWPTSTFILFSRVFQALLAVSGVNFGEHIFEKEGFFVGNLNGFKFCMGNQ